MNHAHASVPMRHTCRAGLVSQPDTPSCTCKLCICQMQLSVHCHRPHVLTASHQAPSDLLYTDSNKPA
jgi:hypothetical protein